MNEWDRTFVDGCAIFFKVDKFKLEDKHLIEFNQLALARPSLRKHKDMYNRVMTRDNISVAVRLEHKESRQEIILGNVHIHWDPTYKDVKLVQAIMLVEELEKIALRHPKAAVILCGDFNSLPDSGVFNFIENGSIGPQHADFMGHTYEPYSNEGASHTVNLKSAYSLSPEPLSFSNFTASFEGVIDYVFFRPGTLSVTGLLGSVPSEYTKQLVGLPSQHFSSDHISLLVEFRLEPPTHLSHRRVGSDFSAPGFDARPDASFNASVAGSGVAGTRRLYSRNKNIL